MTSHTETDQQENDAENGSGVTIGEALQIALERHQQGRLTEAQLIYERILDLAPEYAEAHHFLGLVKVQSGDAEGAEENLRQAIRLDPAYVAAHNNLGNFLQEQGRLDEAETEYRQAISLNPEFADAHNNLGAVLKNQERWDDAEPVLRRAVELQPDHFQALNNLGVLLKEQGDLEAARQLLLQASDLKPDFAEARHNLGLVLAALGDYEAAEAALEKAVAYGVDTYVNLCSILREQARFAEAIKHCRKALALDPDCCDALHHLGMMLEATGQVEEAAGVFRHWTEVEPDNPFAKHMLAACSGKEIPMRATDHYVQSLFDSFAPTFEERLEGLEYCAPQVIVDAIIQRIPPDNGYTALDAGCGTGLCGPLLKPVVSRLIGVDLSRKMLEKAAERKIYEQLIKAELTHFFQTTAERFNLIVSADTLVYFGDLQPVISAAWLTLQPRGLIVFTLERLDENAEAGFHLCPHGRYSHTESYIKSILQESGFGEITVTNETLRMEMGKPVEGLLVIAKKK
ncbi:MAG: hypothetical protein DIZ78_02235 [endosymbiont of Escarpia spicata]|uniref:Methyltransferase type 11 domain-containing protein n=1 Tax=endosymbiont of Escarpia spicata TaxID=2200908 RepID=A0A370DST6_9GAMM|nr:MAG: hypothetical protein DIZ78_02235 [endosymbiont of Escarpia spicata]